MDNKEAKKLLREHTTALQKLLGDDLKDEALKQAKAAKLGKRTLIDRIKEFPVVEKVTSLGTAGTVAVSTAAVAQTELAVNYTEIVVAQVAEDVYTGVIEPPGFIDSWVDFDDLHVWGQDVIADKISSIADSIPESPDVSDGTSSDVPSEQPPSATEQSQPVEESKEQAQEKSEEEKPPSEKEKVKEEKSEQTEKEVTEDKKQSEEKVPSEESKDEPKEDVKSVEKVETPAIDMEDPIKPHDMVNPSPVR